MRGTLEMDVIIAFLTILTMFMIVAYISYESSYIQSKKIADTSEFLNAIKNSYMVLDNIKEDKDNEIDSTTFMNKIEISGIEVELYAISNSGEIYKIVGNLNPRIDKVCINRGVYIKDLKLPGILKICTEVKK